MLQTKLFSSSSLMLTSSAFCEWQSVRDIDWTNATLDT